MEHIEVVRSLEEKYKDICVCIWYEPDDKYFSDVVDEARRNLADFYMTEFKATNINVISIQSVQEGIKRTIESNQKYMLCIRVGTITHLSPILLNGIYDQLQSDDYKFLGHILEHENGSFYIHPQFFLLDAVWATENNVNGFAKRNDWKHWTGHVIERSEESFHDGYTPTWLKGTDELKEYECHGYGYDLIEQLASTKSKFAPWQEPVRHKKDFAYAYVNEFEALKAKTHIMNFANQNKTYVCNTETVDIEFLNDFKQCDQIYIPASGILTFIWPYLLNAKHIHVYDSNPYSIMVYRKLFEEWDGTNYADFIRNNFPIYDDQLFVATEYLDEANESVNRCGEEFLSWWRDKEFTVNFLTVNIFSRSTWPRLRRGLENKKTLINLSNIMHYYATSVFLSTEEKYQILDFLREYLEQYIDKDNLFFYGKSPIENKHTNVLKFRGRFDINDYDFSEVRNYPWRKKR